MKYVRVMIESVLQLAEPRAGNTILQALSEEEFQARYSGNGTGQP
jgi:hypothetical protein